MSKSTPTLAAITAQTKPVEVVVPLCVAGDLYAEHERLERELEQAQGKPRKLSDPDPAPAIAKKVQAVEAKMREHTYDFVFVKVDNWLDLIDEHGPREGKERQERWNPTTFPPAAVSASAVSPEGMRDAETFAAFWDKLSQGQRRELFDGAFRANEEAADVPFSVIASAALSRSGPSSTTPAPAASR